MEKRTALAAESPTRRRFVQASAAALAAPAFLGAQPPNEEIHVGIIGVGGRGTSLLERVVRSPGVKVTDVCDIDSAAVDRALTVIGGEGVRTYSDYRRLLDEKEVDALVIATPVDEHKEMAVAALGANKHLYLEKPIAAAAKEVHAVYEASQASKALLQLGFQLRFDPSRSTAIRHIREGGIGGIVYMQGDRHTPDLPRRKPWLFDASVSGNSIVEQAVHIIDLMNWAMDGHPAKAMGLGGISLYEDQPRGRTTWDHYVAVFEYPNGVRFTMTHIFFDPRGFSGIKERIWGSDYAIDLPSARKYELDPQARRPAPWVQLEVSSPGEDMTQLAVNGFFESVRENKEPLNNALWGKYATLTAIMGRTAIEEGRTVTWEEVDAP